MQLVQLFLLNLWTLCTSSVVAYGDFFCVGGSLRMCVNMPALRTVKWELTRTQHAREYRNLLDSSLIVKIKLQTFV
jgi:hypothetical protein